MCLEYLCKENTEKDEIPLQYRFSQFDYKTTLLLSQLFNKNSKKIFVKSTTVNSILETAASIHFDEIFAQNLLSKKLILLRLLFEGGF